MVTIQYILEWGNFCICFDFRQAHSGAIHSVIGPKILIKQIFRFWPHNGAPLQVCIQIIGL